MIAVECRAWAENIQHDRMERRGLAHFEVTPDHSKYLDMLQTKVLLKVCNHGECPHYGPSPG